MKFLAAVLFLSALMATVPSLTATAKAACQPVLVIQPISVNVGEAVSLGVDCKGGSASGVDVRITTGDGALIIPDSPKHFRVNWYYQAPGTYEVVLTDNGVSVDSASVIVN